MTREQWLWLILGGAVVTYLVLQRKAVVSVAQTGVEDVTAILSGWQTVKEGPTWVPVINQTETAFGIPTNLLARMAYQESHFRPEIIDGRDASSAGALGILQLMPQFFDTVQRPTPFTTQDTLDQINQAAQQIVALHNRYDDWSLALAGYNDGAGNVDKYLDGKRALPKQTTDYVAQILADVPVAPNTLEA